MNTEQMLLTIHDLAKTRIDAALVYAAGLKIGLEVHWPTVNQAIMRRWSRSGLQYIKRHAWGIVEGREVFGTNQKE